MLAFLASLKTWAQLALGGLVGASLAFGLVMAYGELIALPRAREAGRMAGSSAELAKWQTAMEKQRAKNEADRQAAQAKIDKIEKQYLDLNASATTRAQRISDLEQALAQEQADNAQQMADNQQPAGAHPAVCPPAFSRGVSNRLNHVGAADRIDPAKPAR